MVFNMSKIIINYDFINEIGLAKGKYKLIRTSWKIPFVYKLPIFSISFISVFNSAFNDFPWSLTLPIVFLDVGHYYCILAILSKILDKLNKLSPRVKTLREISFEKIQMLSHDLNVNNIKTTPELLLGAKFYKRKYSLAMEGLPGIIRKRYIYIPTQGFNEKIEDTSILEEHRLGTRKYEISVQEPEKKKQLKLAYGI